MTDHCSRSPWYALRVKSNFERVVSAQLRSSGFDEFLPVYRIRRRWSDRVKEIEAPLFPGYIFARFEVGNRLPILKTPGVVAVVGIGKQPVAVPEQEVDAVRRVLASELTVYPWPFLRLGQPVRIEGGALEGVEGIFIETKGRHRLVVSVEILQRSVSVEVDRESVRSIVDTPGLRQDAAA